MRLDEAGVVTRYHREGISTGFLSTLGDRFLRRLYVGIAKSRYGLVLVAVDAADRAIGFAAGATDVKALYRSILLRRGWLLAGSLIGHLLRPSTVGRIIESLRYPQQVGGTYPRAELLSIVVDAGMRGSGAAAALLYALLGEFRDRGCSQIKVIVGAELGRANAFYVKHGFRRAGSIRSHGAPANVYVIETNRPSRS